MPLTNKERWDSLTDGLCSPQNMLDWSFRFVIAASLQRRVWIGPEHKQLFSNMYGVLFGLPGIGKSLCLDEVSGLLKALKKKDIRPDSTKRTEAEQLVIKQTEDINLSLGESNMVKAKKDVEKAEPPLFPYAPDATTYEALVEFMAGAFRRITYTKTLPDGSSKLAIYGHCSGYFCLDELGSLFRKKSDAVVNYLLGLYACPNEYEYKTKNSGEDRVLRGCLNFLAGTTPDFMEEIASDKLIGKGFTARCYFICANKNRKNVSKIPPLTDEQIKYRLELLEHIKKLAMLYGEVKIDTETDDFIQKWWNDCENNKQNRPNKSSRLDGYYARKLIHMYKVTMMNHFMESTDLHITLDEVKEAIRVLDKEELTMHLALTVDSSNPLSKVSNNIYNYIVKHGKVNIADLLVEFWDNLPQGNRSLDEILPHLIASDKIEDKVLETGERVYVPKL